jgi:DNA-binding Xre family transcriptional regulator
MAIRCTLRAFRKQHKVSLRALAEGTGLRPSTLNDLERNLTSRIEKETIEQVVRYFQARGIACEVGDLLVYEPDRITSAPP